MKQKVWAFVQEYTTVGFYLDTNISLQNSKIDNSQLRPTGLGFVVRICQQPKFGHGFGFKDTQRLPERSPSRSRRWKVWPPRISFQIHCRSSRGKTSSNPCDEFLSTSSLIFSDGGRVNIVHPKRSMRASGRGRLSMLSSRVPPPPQRICENNFGRKDCGKRATNNPRKVVEKIFLRTANKQLFAMDQLSEACRKVKVGCAQRLLPMKDASSKSVLPVPRHRSAFGHNQASSVGGFPCNTVVYCQGFLISENHECWDIDGTVACKISFAPFRLKKLWAHPFVALAL